MSEINIKLYQAWIEGWRSATDQEAPVFITEHLSEKLALLMPMHSNDLELALKSAYDLGRQNAQATFEPNSRIL